MAIVINGSGTVTGLAVGGLPDGTVDSGTIATGTIVNADINASAAIAGSKLTGVGITEADQWRLTTDFTGNVAPISSNLEQIDSDSFGVIGTGMTLSSGIFTFPSTGVWKVESVLSTSCSTSNESSSITIQVTQTDGSAWNNASQGHVTPGVNPVGNTVASGYTCFMLNVPNTSTHKVRFDILNQAGSTVVRGNTGKNETYFTFIRLGDT